MPPKNPPTGHPEAGSNAVLNRKETMSRDELEAPQLSRPQHTVANPSVRTRQPPVRK